MAEPLILVVGGADTGRAPMAAALLQRILERQERDWPVESAGVVGHDNDPAEPEARAAMLALGSDIGAHRARSLDDNLVTSAALLLAVDSGVARVVRARYPEVKLVTLGELAGRQREIPDPFRMQVGAWIQYAREIEALLGAGIERLIRLIQHPSEASQPEETQPKPNQESEGTNTAPPPDEVGRQSALNTDHTLRRAAVERITKLLALVADMPAVVDWTGARRQIELDLAIAEEAVAPNDLSRPYAALVRAMIVMAPNTPTPAQAVALSLALARLRNPISSAELDAISGEIARFGGK